MKISESRRRNSIRRWTQGMLAVLLAAGAQVLGAAPNPGSASAPAPARRTQASPPISRPTTPRVQAQAPRPADATDASLAELYTGLGTLEPAFVSTTLEYTLTVPYTQSVHLIYTTTWPLAYANTSCGYLIIGVDCSLPFTRTVVPITVLSEDFSAMQIYTVTILRPEGVAAPPRTEEVTQLGQGSEALHRCVILITKEVACWGVNESGQLGRGDFETGWRPVTITGITDAVQVALGVNHTCIRRTGGTVQCTGANEYGQLGDGSHQTRTVPVSVLAPGGNGPLTGVTDIGAGNWNTCAVVGGNVLCWGVDHAAGYFDPNTFESVYISTTTPVTVPGIDDAVSVRLGLSHGCALTASGMVKCWGNNPVGGFGDGTQGITSTSAITMLNATGTAPLTGASDMGVGYDYTCVLVAGSQMCTGYNYYMTIGDGTTDDRSLLTQTQMFDTGAPLTNLAQTSPGDQHNCARSTAGYVLCSGRQADYGFLGIGKDAAVNEMYHRVTTVTVSAGGPPLAGVLEISSNAEQTCARTASRLYCWGVGEDGANGTGLFENAFSPAVVFEWSADEPGAADDASLIDLQIDPGTLAPAFVSTTTSYTAEVPAGTTQALVTATTNDVSATVAYASTAGTCTPGNASPSDCAIASSGTTTITVTVTAADLATTKIYTIVVTAVDEPHASELVIDIPGLTPTFVSTTLNYQTEVPSGTNQLVVTPTLSAGATAEYSSTAGSCTDNGTSGTCPLFPTKSTTVTIGVTDGATTRNYTILATRPSAPGDERKYWFPLVPKVR